MHLAGYHLVLGIKVDGTGVQTLTHSPHLVQACLSIAKQLRGVVRDRLVDCLSLGQSVVEFIGHLNRTDGDTLPPVRCKATEST